MGDDGTIKMSEDPSLCAIYREARADAVSWDDLTQKGYVRANPIRRATPRKWTCARPRNWRNTRFLCSSTSRRISRTWKTSSTRFAERRS